MAPTTLEPNERLSLGQFLAKAVTFGTRSGYEGDWRKWLEFIGKRQGMSGNDDVYLDKVSSDTERATLLALFLKERYTLEGMRGRVAITVSASIRHAFMIALRPVDWFDSDYVTKARAACRRSGDKIRIR